MFLAISVAITGTASAQGTDYTVNSLGDVDDGTCDVTHCSLREAVDDAQNTDDRVVFDFTLLGGSAPFEIELDDPLIAGSDDVIITGLECTGCGGVSANSNDASAGFNSTLAVRIVPSLSYSGGDLVLVTGQGVDIVGLNIDGSPDAGLRVTNSDVLIEDCFIGTSITGGTGTGNGDDGIEVSDAADLEITSCLLSGNGDDGIDIHGQDSDRPIIQTNIIGLEITASTAVSNGGEGIKITGSGDDILEPTIGGLSAPQGNVISGNVGDGIRIVDKVDGNNLAFANTDGVIGFNIVGTNGAVTAAVPNGGSGLRLQGGTDGGEEPKELLVISNVFSGNDLAGVYVQSAKEDVFHSNAIGTNLAGTLQLGNDGEGIYLVGGTTGGSKDTKDMVIGGAGVQNEIAYNGGDGVRVRKRTAGNVKDNRIDANSIHDNDGIGIDLEQSTTDSGVSDPAAGCSSTDSWGNQGLGMPVITSSTVSGGVLTVVGTSCNNFEVDVYLADDDGSGYGEPETYVGNVTATSSNWTFVQAVSGVVNSTLVTAVQRRGDGDTSEAAANVFTAGPCDVDGDLMDSNTGGLCVGADCDDDEATVYDGAPELCDGLDNACAGSVPTNEVDGDGDGFFPCQNDCNDSDILVFPGQTEACNGVDDDCDGLIPTDETDDDTDGDNECADGDCDDTDSSVFVGATEVCDGVDTDCDTVIDDGFDSDGDTVTTCGPDGVLLTADDDCDDAVASTFPGATEVCDAVDQDCDTVVDDGFDLDSDTVTTCGADGVLLTADDDCDDAVATTFPGATETCNGVDDDCSGALNADEADADGDGEMTCAGDCDDTLASVNTSGTEVCNIIDDDCDTSVDEGFDFDVDGFTTCGADGVASTSDDDCDDIESSTFPGATESCDGVDQDCDSLIDDGFDTDGDTITTCGPDGLFSTTDDDCDDTEITVFPGATEIPDDGVDQDCSGTDTVTCFVDGDLDGFGTATTALATDGDCTDSGESTLSTDCDDSDILVFPGQTEACNGVDDDCSGALNADEADADNDGEMTCDGDCDDAVATVNTSATEICNIIDDDCDTSIDEGFDVDVDGFTTCGADGVAGNTDDDCDDGEITTFPGANEVCDAVDQDCDGLVDDGFDTDSDTVTTCGPDGVSSTADDDCDDTSATVFPGATEIPDDGIDQDCDGTDTVTCFEDIDTDGVGSSFTLLSADGDCLDTFESATTGDCDDTEITTFPGAAEICDGVDQDCDTDIDEDFDADSDGYPIGASCTVTVDCDDTNAAINPAATELCDGVDNNCNGVVDEDADADNDGYTNCQGDCDDNEATINPGATELCDGEDTDCDTVLPADELDDDSDGEMPCDGDCDDTNAAVNTIATEVCNAIDDDCDSSVDEGFDIDGDLVTTCGPDGVLATADDDCDDGSATVLPGATEICDAIDQDCDGTVDEGFDVDGDGVTTCGADGFSGTTDDDCDDTDATALPGGTEIPDDGIDQDCSGADTVTCYVDLDGDGVGTTAIFAGDGNCTDAGEAPIAGDCDDTAATVFPGASEVCNGVDEDCDGAIDEDFDADGDGYPVGISCTGPVDCDDTNNAVNPGATEVCDGIDNNCDGTIDEEVDGDSDGFTGCDGDCDDNDATVYPGATELCDGLDNDCDSVVPADETDDDADGFDECADGDCDDTDALVFPGQTETCDGVDEDCDTDIDEDLDDDGDGFDDCVDGDCDDADDQIYPGQTEVCDGVDEDCDGVVDNGFDGDADGSTTCGPDGITGNEDDDCDDAEPLAYPEATEVCDSIDNDCDGTIDEEADDDGDGFTNCEGDCDDSDATINPDADESCDGADSDCDGVLPDDEADDDLDGQIICDGDCDDADATVFDGADELCDGLDNDCDGAVPDDETDDDGDDLNECADDDCDDADATIFPGAEDICDDGIDQDCDGLDAECVVPGNGAEVTLGEVPGCATERSAHPAALLVFLGLLVVGIRRRVAL